MHKAKYCIVTCIDFRLQKAYSNFIESRQMLSTCDVISLAGCSRDLVKPIENWHKDALLRQIELSVKLHNPDTLILLDHQDCGGYAQDSTIAQGLTVDQDRLAHSEWGKIAKAALLEKFPGKSVQVYYFQLDGKVEEL